MRGLSAFIIYIIAAVISGIIKRAAEQKMKSQRPRSARTAADGEAGVVKFEDIEPAEEIFADFPEEEREEEPPAAAFSDLGFTRRERTKPIRTKIERRRPNMSQAVIMSEILRPPRIKRPWPLR